MNWALSMDFLEKNTCSNHVRNCPSALRKESSIVTGYFTLFNGQANKNVNGQRFIVCERDKLFHHATPFGLSGSNSDVVIANENSFDLAFIYPLKCLKKK